MDAATRGRTYLEHLTRADRELLARIGDLDPAGLPRHAERVEGLLARPATYEAVFPADGDEREPFLGVSPFLAFAVAVHRARDELARRAYLQEWTGPRQRVPVFVTDELRGFLDDPDHRLFLVELLASYTHVASGAVTTRRGGVVHRRRYNELDLASLAGLLEVVDEEARPGLYRRLGDLTLLLTGVFPDHTARQGLGGIDLERLTRTLQPGAGPRSEEVVSTLAGGGAVGLLEQLGQRWYAQALHTVPVRTRALAPLASVGERFVDARRILNHITDTHLFPFRARWFPSAG